MNTPPLTEEMMLQVMLAAWGVLAFLYFIWPGTPSYI